MRTDYFMGTLSKAVPGLLRPPNARNRALRVFMSDEDSARNRKAGTSREGDEEKKNDETKDAKVPPKQDLYSRFVESFENALNSVTSTVSNAVKAGAGRNGERYQSVLVQTESAITTIETISRRFKWIVLR
ncbi:hypothetical protein Y032_0868g2778 [Ancylostoma ceylanicum]|uniref:Uncharacterized protein n=2 Tax=Ancylostoma ceylanicum TaxID=53326 RepID=A0A016WAN6_9BILA|nr:hypothetical protein Y032_0868g2778 [Ancylostoma ceylanicum]